MHTYTHAYIQPDRENNGTQIHTRIYIMGTQTTVYRVRHKYQDANIYIHLRTDTYTHIHIHT